MLLSHWPCFSLTTTDLTSAPWTLPLALPEFSFPSFSKAHKIHSSLCWNFTFSDNLFLIYNFIHYDFIYIKNIGEYVINDCMLCHFSHVQFFVTLWAIDYQAPLSMGFSRKESGVGWHFLLQGIFPTQGSNPSLLHLQHCHSGSLSRVPPEKPHVISSYIQYICLVIIRYTLCI